MAEARVTLKVTKLALHSRSDQMALNTATKCSAMQKTNLGPGVDGIDINPVNQQSSAAV